MTEIITSPDVREIRHFHFCCGSGAGAKGANRAKAEVGMMRGKFRCIGGIDNNRGAIVDFGNLAGVPGTMLDLFSLDQYLAFFGHMPPPGWREATRADIHRAAHNERPHVVLMSCPCKGFSGLLSEKLSLSTKYQALNQLALRCLHLALDAWSDDPPEFFLFENVPRVQTRGRGLLDQVTQLFHAYGYAAAETTHDCGELGGLGQSRKRFLMVARHIEKVPPFLYEPVKRPLRSVGHVLEQLPMPGEIEVAGPMHRIPTLHWKTWVRLAFVEAGSDWRSLQKLRVENGFLQDYALLPEADYRDGVYGVRRWSEPSGTIAGESSPSNGAFSVADPRVDGHVRSVQMGVRPWDQPAPTVTGQMTPGQGPNAVADPRMGETGPRFNNVYRVVRWGETAPAVTAGAHPTAGGNAIADPRPGRPPSELHGKYHVAHFDESSRAVIAGRDNGASCIADPRPNWDRHGNNLVVEAWNEPSRTVIGGGKGVQGGQLSIADPRLQMTREPGDAYRTSGHYGVVPWSESSGTITASLRYDSGPGNVADPRLPAPTDKVVAIIRSQDNTWHRPFTIFEKAALQGMIDPGERFELEGKSESAWNERIGNAIPPPATEAIFGVIGTTLLLAWAGETFVLGATPIWVRDIAIALAVDQDLPS